jgi:hypothetical protein
VAWSATEKLSFSRGKIIEEPSNFIFSPFSPNDEIEAKVSKMTSDQKKEYLTDKCHYEHDFEQIQLFTGLEDGSTGTENMRKENQNQNKNKVNIVDIIRLPIELLKKYLNLVELAEKSSGQISLKTVN